MRAILHDVTRCLGCMKCVEACATDNGLYEDPLDARFDPGALSDRRFTSISDVDGRSVRRQCMHCLEPSCASACLVGALEKTPEGPVLYDATRCIGCRYCMIACPYHALRYKWVDRLPFMKKCDLCHDRPNGPACVEACPHDATMYGEREELLRIARQRVRERPDLYLEKVWGETEAGGTCILYVSDTPLDRLFPVALGETSIPEMTWPLARSTPFLAVGVAGFLVGASWIIGRRNRLAEELSEAAPAPEGGAEGDS